MAEKYCYDGKEMMICGRIPESSEDYFDLFRLILELIRDGISVDRIIEIIKRSFGFDYDKARRLVARALRRNNQTPESPVDSSSEPSDPDTLGMR